MKILFLNGPNLNMLGIREPDIYGKQTYADLETYIRDFCRELDISCEIFQSNHEGALVDAIQAAWGKMDAIVINPGGLTHTSVSLRDALAGVNIPFFEVHISNIHQREPFRHHSYLSGIAKGVICGFGTDGYRMAIEFALRH